MKSIENLTISLTKIGLNLSLIVGVIGGIWLLFLHEWKFVLAYIVIAEVISWIYSHFIITIIGMPIAFIINHSVNNNKTPIVVSVIINFILNSIIMYLWIGFVTYNFYNFIKITGYIVPIGLLGYCISTLPLFNLAAKSTDSNIISCSLMAFVQIIYFCLIGAYLVNYYLVSILIILVSLIIFIILIRKTTIETIVEGME